MNRPANQLDWSRFEPYIPESRLDAAPASLGEPDDVEWSDYGKSIMSGGASLVQSVGWLANVLGAEDIGSSIEELGSDAVDYWNDSLSEPAKAEIAKQVIRKNDDGEYEWADPSFSTIGLMGAQSLLATAAGMGTGAGLTKVLQVFANPVARTALVAKKAAGSAQAAKKLKLIDSVLGAGGFGLGEGSIGGISAGASVYDNIMNLDHTKLMGNERYQQVYNSTDESMSELERHQYAADTVAKEASTSAGWQSGLTTSLLGAPMGAYFGRILGGAKLSNTYLKGIATGAAGEAAQEFAQSGVEQYISNIETMPFDPAVDKFDDVLNAAVSGALAGALMGGPFGAAGVGQAKTEVAIEAQERMAGIGGPLKAPAQNAAAAGADQVAVMEIVNDAVTQRITPKQAIRNLNALEKEAKAGMDENGEPLEPANATQPPPEAGKAPASTQPSPTETAQSPTETAQAEEQPAEAKAEPTPEQAEESLVQAAQSPTAFETVNPMELEVDPARFQFKSQTDEQGVSKALKGIKTFEPFKAGGALVWEDKSGKRFIVDGHQRVALAKRAVAAGQDPADVYMSAYVVREADGVTAEMATGMAALKNIAEGTGSAVDAATVIREMGPEAQPAIDNLPPTRELVKQGKALANLDKEAFGKIVNEVIDPKHGAIVGELIPEDAALQNAAIEVLRKTEPANATIARSIVDQVRTAGTEVQATEDLFGETTMAESLYLERGRVLDSALRAARRDKATFKTLTSRETSITGTGKNVLDRAANEAKISDADAALTALSTLANTKGPVSDALTEAARRVKAGEKPGSVSQDFLATALQSITGDGQTRRGARKPKQSTKRKVGHQWTGLSPEEQAAAQARTEAQLQGEGIDILPGGATETLFSRKANQDPKGHCFENCGRHIMNNPDDNLVLVHGIVIGQGPIEGVPFAHAWLERRGAEAIGGDTSQLSAEDQEQLGRMAIDLTTDERLENPLEIPAVLYRSVAQAEVKAEYTHDEAISKLAEHKHWGPWDFEETIEARAAEAEARERRIDAEYKKIVEEAEAEQVDTEVETDTEAAAEAEYERRFDQTIASADLSGVEPRYEPGTETEWRGVGSFGQWHVWHTGYNEYRVSKGRQGPLTRTQYRKQSRALAEAERRYKGEPLAAPGTTGEAATGETIKGKVGEGQPLYSRARLQNRPLGGPALAELERRVINPIQTGELNPEEDRGASLLAQSINIKDNTISLPEENKASMAAIADTLDRVVKEARDFRYGEGWRARLGLYGEGPGFGPGRETYEEMTNAINSLQNLRDAVRNSAQTAPVAQGAQEDMFGAPPAPEPAPPPPEQGALFSRRGKKPLDSIMLTREVEVAETGEVFEVEQSAAILLRQHDKRAGIVEQLRNCVRG